MFSNTYNSFPCPPNNSLSYVTASSSFIQNFQICLSSWPSKLFKLHPPWVHDYLFNSAAEFCTHHRIFLLLSSIYCSILLHLHSLYSHPQVYLCNQWVQLLAITIFRCIDFAQFVNFWFWTVRSFYPFLVFFFFLFLLFQFSDEASCGAAMV